MLSMYINTMLRRTTSCDMEAMAACSFARPKKPRLPAIAKNPNEMSAYDLDDHDDEEVPQLEVTPYYHFPHH